MAYYRRKKIFRNKRGSRKRFGVRRKRMARSPRVYNISRTWYGGSWSPISTAVTGYWRYISFALGNMPSYTEFTNLFDDYRINSCKIVLRPKFTGYNGSDNSDMALPGITGNPSTQVHVIIDPGSVVVPSGIYNSTTLNAFLENGKVRSYTGTKPITINLKYPMVEETLFGGSAMKRAPFISTVNTSVPHKGVHIFMNDVNLTGLFTQAFDIFYTYNMSFKGFK